MGQLHVPSLVALWRARYKYTVINTITGPVHHSDKCTGLPQGSQDSQTKHTVAATSLNCLLLLLGKGGQGSSVVILVSESVVGGGVLQPKWRKTIDWPLCIPFPLRNSSRHSSTVPGSLNALQNLEKW